MNPILNTLGESQSIQMAQLANQLRASGRDIVSLALGDSHFPPSPDIVSLIHSATSSGKTHYGDSRGVPALREQIAGELGASWSAENLLLVPGLKQGLFYLIHAIQPRKICILEPAWLGYQATATLNQSQVVAVDSTQSNWLESVAHADFDALIVCSPNNPNGKILQESEVRELLLQCQKKNAWLIADEIYSIFDYQNQWLSFSTFSEFDKLVVCNGFSKSHAMTGFRLGWLASKNENLLANCLKIQQHVATCPNVPTQHGLAEAMRLNINGTIDVDYYRENRELVAQLHPALSPYLPAGGFYYFVPASALVESSFDGNQLATQLLQQAGVAVVPGSAYGDNFTSWIRMSFSIDRDRLVQGIRRIQDFAKGSA